MNILFGATGFVGGHVVEYLFEQGEISKGAFRKGAHLKIMDNNAVQGIEVDLLDHHTLHEAVEGTDTIYSMASPTPFGESPDEAMNQAGILNILEAAQEMKIKSIVHLSCLEVYGFGARKITDSTQPSPSNGYQRSKLETERLMLEFAKRSPETKVVILRPARAVGSRDRSLAGPLLTMIKSGKVVVPGSGKMSFSHPKDIAQAMYKSAAANVKSGSVYMVKSFDASPEELASGIAKAAGSQARVGKQGFMSRSSLPDYTTDQLKAALAFDDQKSWQETGYSPQVGLTQTCDEIAKWYKKDPWATGES